MYMDKRILLTGANSFIGSNIVAELMASNTPVTALVRPRSNTEFLKKLKCYNILPIDNYLDPTLIRKLSMSKPEYVIHCAWGNNELADTKNLIKIIEMSKSVNCKGFISIGSYEEYGKLMPELDEDLICNPDSKLGKIKYSLYLLTKEICKSLNIKHIHIRLGIPYSNKKNQSFYFNDIINNLSRGDKVILDNIFNVKDFVHTSDIARGIISLIENDCEGLYNLSFGKGIEIKSVLNMIYEKLNKKFYYREKNEFSKNISFNLKIDKIYEHTNWKPTISIWDGISLLIQENKFKNEPNLQEFTNRIRSLYN